MLPNHKFSCELTPRNLDYNQKDNYTNSQAHLNVHFENVYTLSTKTEQIRLELKHTGTNSNYHMQKVHEKNIMEYPLYCILQRDSQE